MAPTDDVARPTGDPGPIGLDAFERLDHIASDLIAGAPIPLDRAVWFRAALTRYRTGASDGLSLAAAFGITRRRGERAWWVVAGERRRNDALRACARECFGTLKPAAAARKILTAVTRYQSSRWRVDRALPEADAIHLPPPRRYFFIALKSGRRIPALRQLNEILGAGRHSKKCNLVGVPTARRSREDDRGKFVDHERCNADAA